MSKTPENTHLKIPVKGRKFLPLKVEGLEFNISIDEIIDILFVVFLQKIWVVYIKIMHSYQQIHAPILLSNTLMLVHNLIY